MKEKSVWSNLFARIKRFVPLFIGFLVIVVVLSQIKFEKVVTAFSSANFWLVLVAFLIFLFVVGLKAFRWSAIAKSVFKKAFFSNQVLLYFCGQVTNEVLPTGSGELVKIHFLKKQGFSSSYSLACVLLERLLDVFALLLIGVLGWFFIGFKQDNIVFFVLLIAVISMLFLFVLSSRRLIAWIFSFAARLLPFFRKKITAFGKKFCLAVSFFHCSKRLLLQLFVLTIIAWFFEALTQFFLLLAFNQTPSILLVFAVISLSWIIGTFSFLPGGLGARELVFATLLSVSGFSFEAAFSAAILYRAIVYVVLGFGGGFSFFKLARL